MTPYAPLSGHARWAGRCWAFLFSFGLSVVAQAAIAQEPRFAFEIPAQPLATALEQYSNFTGRDALYKSNLMLSRRSTAVRGLFPSDEALTILLEGTGLVARYATPNSFVLLPAPVLATVTPKPVVAQYYGRIQTSLRRVLCADTDARPGHYRTAVRLWIDPSGNVTKHERLNSAGTPDLDAGIDRTLRRLQIGAAPPAELVQPITIAIVPQAPGVTMGCNDRESERARTAP